MEITTFDVKHESRSEKYKVAATKVIAAKFKSLGFVVDSYQEQRVRSHSRRGFQKHMVRLSNPNLLSTTHDDVRLQLLITNSHDGTTPFKMQLGFFRFVCANGLVVGETFETIKLRHSGRILEEIDLGIDRMVAQVQKLDESIARLKNKTLTTLEVENFITDALKIRNESAQNVDVTVKRPEDADSTNLFQLFNRVQESLVNGGDNYRNANGRTRVMRRMTNINKLTEVNSQLFDLALKYAA